MFFKSALVAITAVLAVNAETFTVEVGADGALAFKPDQITGVKPGDDVEFKFMAKNHTVTQSSFAEPCKALDGGVNSGFLLVGNDTDLSAGQPTWTVTVQTEEPLWFYCRQKTPAVHCAKGMVFSVNPTAEKSQEAFLAKAEESGAEAPASGEAPVAAGSEASSAESSAGAASTGEAASALSDTNGAGRVLSGSAATLLAVAGVISALL